MVGVGGLGVPSTMASSRDEFGGEQLCPAQG